MKIQYFDAYSEYKHYICIAMSTRGMFSSTTGRSVWGADFGLSKYIKLSTNIAIVDALNTAIVEASEIANDKVSAFETQMLASSL